MHHRGGHVGVHGLVRIERAACCTSAGASIRAFAPATLPKAPGYSHAVAARGTVVLTAGEIALDKQGNVVGPGDMQAQTDQVFANVQAALEAAGTDFKHVVKLRCS